MKTRNELGDLFTARGYSLAVEVGVHRGEFSEVILSRWPGILYMVDRWKHVDGYEDIANVSDSDHVACMEAAKKVCARHADRGICFMASSLGAASCTKDGWFDAVYIDADHSKAGVLADLQAWVPKVRSGGVIAGHDYLDGVLDEGVFGVKSAVLEFFGREPDIVTDEKWPTWLYEVRA